MIRIAIVLLVALAQAALFEPAQPDLFGAGVNLVNAWPITTVTAIPICSSGSTARRIGCIAMIVERFRT